MERVAVMPNGRVLCDNKKRHKKKEKHDFKRSEQPKTNSHLNHDVATTKGMKPLMKTAGQKQNNSFRNCEYKNREYTVNGDYEPGCHPHWRD